VVAHRRRRLSPAVAALLVGALACLTLLLGAPAASAAPRPVATVAPVRPVAPAGSAVPSTPASAPSTGGMQLSPATSSALSNPVSLALLLGALSLLPAVLIMVTAFTRIVIVLGFTRSALGTQGVPPNQVLIGLALFLTLFVMGPVLKQVNDDALQPMLHGQITQSQAYDRGIEPLRGFMFKQVRSQDLQLFVDLSGKGKPATPKDVPTTTLIPAFIISELRTAFLIGFIVFVPFVVIDLVVSAALSAMGMAMLPPSLISLPFKLLLFVAVDGWYLLVSSLVRSFA
jgi:flagellar biosynthetic protein FliP